MVLTTRTSQTASKSNATNTNQPKPIGMGRIARNVRLQYNTMPLAPLGTKGVIYISPKARDTLYSDHGKEGWYIGSVYDTYRNYKIYIPSTNGTRDSNAVEFFPTKCRIPNSTNADQQISALEDLAYEMKQMYKNENRNTTNGHGTPVNKAIKSL